MNNSAISFSIFLLIFIGLADVYGSGPCHQEVQSKSAAAPGTFIPACDGNGTYVVKQCDPTGHCWCVTSNDGKEVGNTKRREWEEGTLDCYTNNSLHRPLGPCENQTIEITPRPPPGTYVPQCNAYGYYKPKQCDPSASCWCVHPANGTKIAGPDGEKKQPANIAEFKCNECLQKVSDKLRVGATSHGAPNCDHDGRFAPVQRGGGMTWCVSASNGAEINGTKIRAGDGEPNCYASSQPQADLPKGTCERVKKHFSGIFGFLPKCTSRGYFELIQENTTSKENLCVNPRTGQRVKESFHQRKDECGACIVKLDEYLRKDPGQYDIEPQCDDLGLYNTVQMDPIKGKAWCVLPSGAMVMPSITFALQEGGPQPSCPGANVTEAPGSRGPCAEEAALLGTPPPGTYVPQCTAQGYYKVIQIHGSTARSWCVSPIDGMEVYNTTMGPGTKREGSTACGACHMQAEKALTFPIKLGAYIPRCDWRGNYAEAQVKNGRRFCVDRITGAEIPGTLIQAEDVGGVLICEK